MTQTPTTVDELLDYWPGNIPFKGSLISDDGSCMCAQGQALRFLGGMSAADLRKINQYDADRRVAKLFGISRAHAVLLRVVNDSQPGAPTCVIREPEKVLGSEAQTVLAFWRHLDRMTTAQWYAATPTATAAVTVEAAAEAAVIAATAAAGENAAAAAENAVAAAENAAWAAASWAAENAAWAAAGAASNEIQGAAVMRLRGQPFFFLPAFGFAGPEAVLAADRAAHSGGI